MAALDAGHASLFISQGAASGATIEICQAEG
jgi:hypothetical protein